MELHEKHVSGADDHTVLEEDEPVGVKRLYDDKQGEEEGQRKKTTSSNSVVVGDDQEEERRQQHEEAEGDSIVHVLGTTLEPLVAVVGESARILMGKASPEAEEKDEEEARKVRESAAAMAVAAAGAPKEENQEEQGASNDTSDPRQGGKSLGVIMSSRNHGGWNPIEPTTPSTPGTPLLKRLEHLELNLRSFEDKCSPRSVVDGNNYWSSGSATSSSCLSTPSSIDKRRKPIDDVLEETEEKGTLVERVASLEQRLDTLSMQLSKGDWAPAVPVLKSPPGRAPKNVASAAPSDLPAVEEKHEVPAINGDSKQAEPVQDGVKQEQHKLKKRHKIPHMLKNCFTPGSA